MARAVGYAEGVASYTAIWLSWRWTGKTGRGPRPWPARPCPCPKSVGRQELIASDCRRLAKALVRQGKAAEALPHAQPCRGNLHSNLGIPSDIADARKILESRQPKAATIRIIRIQ